MGNIRIKDLSTQKRAFVADDFIEKDGATEASCKVSPFDGHGQFRNALAPRGGVAFDGVVTASRVYSKLTGQSIGTDPFSLNFVVDIPAAPASGYYGLAHLGPDDSTVSGQAYQIWFEYSSAGVLSGVICGSGTGFNNSFTLSGFGAAYAGKTVMLTFVRPSTGNLLLYINGVAQTLSFATAGTPPTWQGSITSTYLTLGEVIGSELWKGAFYSASLYNLELSAAEVLEIYEHGGAVPERYKFGSQVAAYTSNWTAGVDSWGGSDGTANLSGNIDQDADAAGVPPSNDWLRVTQSGSYNQLYTVRDTTLTVGKVYRLAGSLFVEAGSVMTTAPFGYLGVGYIANGGPTDSYLLVNLAAGGLITFSGQITAAHVKLGFGATNSAGTNRTLSNAAMVGGTRFYAKGVTATQVGAVVHLPLNEGAGLILRDASTNSLHAQMTTSGVSHVLALSGPQRVRRNSATNGNEQLFGQVCIPANAQILRVRAKSRSGTPSVTLGTASAGSQIVASVALSTAWKDLTIALTGGMVGASNISLWAGANSTDIVDWDVTWEPLST